jgi:asparagine synthase (glutamine-hydrolysing)
VSVQFGRWHFEGHPAAPECLEKVSGVLAPYGPDGKSSYAKAGVDILYFAFHTTRESRQETQPFVLKSGAVLSWDGRLDNRTEMIGLFGPPTSQELTDLVIVAAAYERWGTNCFAKLIGDWALSVWNPHDRSLVLAKDPIGARRLFYSAENDQITWCTVLDPLVLFAGRTLELEEEYLAGWLGQFPATHLTPYVGIHAVPPAHFVRIEKGRQALRKYWDFDPDKRIRYQSDAEYEEHFRAVFGESVRRRLRSDSPILVELSGGVDSSSIVCMADALIARECAATPRLDTVSYYSNSEANWNEQPYFTLVEEKRGRAGWHIDVEEPNFVERASRDQHPAVAPGSLRSASEASRLFHRCLAAQGNRVLLSGTGGDEVAGGVPSATSELADLLAGARVSTLAHRLGLWALAKKKPWISLLCDAVRCFLPPWSVLTPKEMRPPPWLCSTFVNRNRPALTGYRSRLRLFGPLPSFQENLATLGALRRQLESCASPAAPVYETRYPFLDRSLLEFLYAVPREQLVRPGQRRSLMRRALCGIVPSEVLNRRRKAFVARAPLIALSFQGSQLAARGSLMVTVSLNIVSKDALSKALVRASASQEGSVVALLRTLALESWLQDLLRTSCLDVQAFQSRHTDGLDESRKRSSREKSVEGVQNPFRTSGTAHRCAVSAHATEGTNAVRLS